MTAGFRWMAVVLLVLASGAGRVAAQVQVSAAQGLAFGQLVAGVAKTIARTDGSRAGKFTIQGPSSAPVMLQLVLPTVMSGPGSATLPLTFGATDAAYAPNTGNGNQTVFDPRTPFSATLGGNGRGIVSLGGTARAAASGQAGGTYTATLTLIVALLQ